MANWELLNTTEYGTLVWPDDIDIAPEEVWDNGFKCPEICTPQMLQEEEP